MSSSPLDNPILPPEAYEQQKASGISYSDRGGQQIYLKQIAEYPRLTPQEELYYTRQYFETTQSFIEELKGHPGLVLQALIELDEKKSTVRIGNIIELTETEDANYVRQLLPVVIEQLKELNPTEEDYMTRFNAILEALRLRPAFYEHCHELLKQEDVRRKFIDDEKWGDIEFKLDMCEQFRKEALGILVERSLRLVFSIAKKHVRDGVSLSDLIQEGNLGLMKGVEKFDYRLGHRLSTYVTYWINQAIMRSLTNTSRIIRISASMLKQISTIKAAAADLLQKNGEEPSPEAIADAVGLPAARVRALLKMAEQPISLQASTEQEKHLEDIIPDENTPPPHAEADFASLKDSIQKALATLSSREQLVLKKRYGLDDNKPLTLIQVANELNISRERVRQIEESAIKKLRSPESSQYFEGYK